MSSPRKIFCAYAPEDERLRKQLDAHLAPLKRAKRVDVWNDRRIVAGSDWRATIQSELDSADMILLLISASFINSDFCYCDLLERAVKRHNAGTAVVIPVIMRRCDWRRTPVGNLRPLPSDARPIAEWSNKDKAYYDVVDGLQRAFEHPYNTTALSAGTSEAGELPIANNMATMGSPADQDPPPVLERLISIAKPYVRREWFAEGLRLMNAVVLISASGETATGFLVAARSLSPNAPPDKRVVLTCSYFSGFDTFPSLCHNTSIVFQMLGLRKPARSVLWSSPAKELGVAVLSLDEEPRVPPCTLLGEEHPRPTEKTSTPVVMGYPLGGSLALSFWDNRWLDYKEPKYQYQAETEPGSSGSPVFDETWRVVAMHQLRSHELRRLSSSGTYSGCQGISMRAIRLAISKARIEWNA